MARYISTGIDIGTHHVRVVVGERVKKGGKVYKRILGTGETESKGLHYGYIINTADAARSIQAAVQQAEKDSGVSIRKAHLSVGGVSLESTTSKGSIATTRADATITELDIEKANTAAEESLSQEARQNRRIIHAIPVRYKIDGKELHGRPLGMEVLKLEVEILAVSCLTQHLDDLIEVVEKLGIEVEDVVASPIAAGIVNLTKAQRVAGVVLTNIGAETVSIIVYENNVPVSIKVFPIGSTDITHDIALGLKIPLEEAEEIKVRSASQSTYPRKKLDDIISARLTDIFELIEAHLKKIKRNGLLPAGIVVTGGGSGLATVKDLARGILQLPSSTATLSIQTTQGTVRDASWSVAYGLCIFGLTAPDDLPQGVQAVRRTKESILGWVKQLLP